MKHAIQAVLTVETPAKQSKLAEEVVLHIAGKPLWGKEAVITGFSDDGRPQVSIEVRFDKEADAIDLFDYIKECIEKIPILTGSATRHLCYHDETPSRKCEPLFSWYAKE